MIDFYDISEDYIKFLKKYDERVPNVNYLSNNKFVCGIVLNIKGIEYYAPVSHTTEKFRTSLIIKDKKDRPISSIRFSFMFPALDSVLTVKDFAAVRSIDPQYASLLDKEYEYCVNHYTAITQRALSTYKIGCNPKHQLNYTCCNFKLLESIYKQYNQE